MKKFENNRFSLPVYLIQEIIDSLDECSQALDKNDPKNESKITKAQFIKSLLMQRIIRG